MQNEEGETPLRTSTLVVFQKLSLGREAQSKMINLDVIKWTVDKLKVEGQILNSYSLEYAFALLMNLSLRTQGKRKFEELHSDALNVLNEFLEHENSEVRTYVNGTLYCILERPKIREEARSLNMDEVLRILSKKFEPRFKRQIDYILDQLEGDKEGEGEGEADIKDDNSSDALDGNSEEGEFADVESIDSEGDDYSNYEDEEDDFSKIPLQGEEAEMFPRGEKWLMQEFLLDDNEEANKQDMILYSKVEEYNEERRRRREIMEKKRMEESMTSSRDQDAHLDKPHMRPLTPSKVPSQKYKDKASVFEPDSSSRNMASDISRSRYEMQRTPPDRDVRVREALSPLSRNQHSVSSPAKSMKASAPMEASFERKEEEKEEKEEHGIYIDHNEDKQIIPKEENLQDQNQNKKENDEKLKDPEKQAEHQEAFTGKDKIRRTPPKESKLRYLREKKKKMQQKPHLYK
mmetsp:Transcript_15710/g.15494  ORF Transcript_15710/g.15494 Transcript_15710/m.15494 type:complete len:462 (+) Transcript_15710:434-1819(+)